MYNFKKIKLTPSLNLKLLEIIPYNVISEIKVGKDFTYSILDDSELSKLNKKIIDDLLSNIPLNNSCIGFVKNKSYLDFLEPHRISGFFTRLDISSFFHSIEIKDIVDIMNPYLSPEYLDKEKTVKTIDRFLNAVTYTIPLTSKNIKFRGKKVLPMGYSSSPLISNIIFRKIDIQIQKYCQENNVIYTRYADDMLFSSNKKHVNSSEFVNKIRKLVSQLSLRLNDKKTITTSGHISLNGYVIDGNNKVIRLSNTKISKINKITHHLLVKKSSPIVTAKKIYGYSFKSMDFKYGKSEKFFNQYCKDQLFNKIVGNRSYLISLLKYHEKNNCLCSDFISKLNKILDRLNCIIDEWN